MNGSPTIKWAYINRLIDEIRTADLIEARELDAHASESSPQG